MPEAKLHRYEGESLTVTYDVKRCIHAAECVRRLPEVFDPKSRPWVRPDDGPAETVADVVAACPTGALRCAPKESELEEAAPSSNQGRLVVDGPLYLHAQTRLIQADGTSWEDLRIALCRCGASSNKPFCDGAHSKAEFRDNATCSEPRLLSESSGSGPLKATLATDGPVVLDGPLEIVGADGEPLFRGEKVALCRCGASSNKPFCDGSHKGIGFKAP